ncbi:LysR family transcriptional regulator [Pseudohaliea sp.]|uniref:LysR family transcriptional regulator n=1 Tax=Pseudohaliea sp. TaxID=2740289 RepID=UPI0032EC0DEB
MQDLNNLYYFAQVVEHGGFAPAGRALNLPKSKLSRRVAQLEQALGTRLLHRSSRRFSVTPLGRQFYEHCRAMLVEAEAAEQAIAAHQREPRGHLSVTCPTGLLGFHVGDLLAGFLTRYPRVSIDLEATNRRVDVVAEGVDIALRVRPLPIEDSDLVMRSLSDRGQVLVASPQLLQQVGEPACPAELSSLPSLSRGTAQSRHQWVLEDGNGREERVAHEPRYVTTDMAALLAAAKAGAGIVQLPLLMVGNELRAGALVPVLPGWNPPREIIHLVFPSRRGLLPAVRALIEHLAEAYRLIEED